MNIIRHDFTGSLLLGAMALIFTPAALSPAAADEPPGGCEPAWVPTFDGQPGMGGVAGIAPRVRALTVWNGDLIAGGEFTTAGGQTVNRIARWDGEQWHPFTSGGQIGVNGRVYALTVWNGDLIAGGEFTTAGGQTVNRIARWDGSSWSPLGSGVSGQSPVAVSALAVFDDGLGGGPVLFAGGNFTSAGDVAALRIAKWDGSSWSALSTGMSGGEPYTSVHALTIFDDGTGPALYAGGQFTTAGNNPVNYIARWNGLSWSPVGSGTNMVVFALTVFDDGTGSALYVGGRFTTAGNNPANYIARWNGSSWSPLGSGMHGTWYPSVRALTVFDDGTGPALYAGGEFTTAGGVTVSHIAKWDGSSWSPLGSGMGGPWNPSVLALAVFDVGSAPRGPGPALYAGGHFTSSGSVPGYYIAKWDGSSWSPLTSGMNGSVSALTVFDDGSAPQSTGPALYVGGSFTWVGGMWVNRIARWDGSSWSPLSSGMSGSVAALTVFDDGTGPALYAGGWFTTAGGMTVNHIAQWDGSSWSPLGSGMDGWVVALTVYDDGSGPALYAGGSFTTAGGVAANGIAKWDGESWSALGSGMNNWVDSLTVFDDGSGSGPALYAGGAFTTAGGMQANFIARWDGESWSALGSGMNSIVDALTVFDDGSGTGPALYAGGKFTTAGGETVNRIAKWDGLSWSPLGSGMSGRVYALAVWYGDLIAGGEFTTAGGQTVNRIARWDGSSWSPLASGVSGPSAVAVSALTVIDDGLGGPVLYAGGSFTVSPAGDSFLAKWQGCPVQDPCQWDFNGDGVVDGADLGQLLANWGSCADCDDCPWDVTGDCVVNGADLGQLLANWGECP